MNRFKELTVVLFIIFAGIANSCKKEAPAKLPVLSTTSVTNLTTTTAVSGGIIIADGGATILANGVCWNTTLNPSTDDSKTVDPIGNAQFVSSISGLTASTTYHIRAYATNSVGTAYGADISFTTLGEVPTVTTLAATNLAPASATLNGTVNANYLSTTVSFEYGLTTNYGQIATASQSPVTGNSLTNVSADISGLTPCTTYHYRAKAVNSVGTEYGSDIQFSTLGQVPSVTTLDATDITTTSSTLNGTVNANYLSTVVTFEYGLTTNYGSTTTAIQNPVMGNTSTIVSAGITGLSLGTSYHFRIIGVNTLGTTYGSDKIFSTTDIPALNTKHASALTTSTASSGGNIISDGGAAIIAKGVCWSTSQNPTVNDSKTMEGTGSENFLSTLTGLMTNTYYYVRSYAINSAGIGYGDEVKFNLWMGASPDFYRDRQGHLYGIVRIGDQEWLQDNIRSTVYQADGEEIPLVTDADEWKNLTTPAYCWFNNDEAQKFRGALYNWHAVNTGKLCPGNMHVPTDSDWKKLEMFLGMSQTEADAEFWRGTTQSSLLKNASAWSNSGNTNLSGFSAKPGYYRHASGVFPDYAGSIYEYASWWTSTESSSENAINRALDYNSPGVYRNTSQGKNGGHSVRCVKDN
jgi:uncharacterized protein (TIGR02145 family)